MIKDKSKIDSEKMYRNLLEYSLRIISRKSYTESEIRKKFDSFCKRRDMDDPTVVEKVIARLVDLKYLDDGRFVQAYATSRMNFAPRGKRLLSMELLRRGVSKPVIENELNKLEIDELEMAERIAEKYQKKLVGLEKNVRNRRMIGFLGRKGFNLDTIYKILSRC